MMTEEERMQKIRLRTAEIRKHDQKQKQFLGDLGCVAACLAVIICIGLYMPSVTESLSFQNLKNLRHSSVTASIIGQNGALGYIIMGILSFVLGVCVTILLYRIRERSRQNRDERNPDEF